MTQEQKAKRYDEAIARAKAILKVTDNMRESLLYVSTIFPELKESEDERIRKDLIQWINEFPDTIWRGHYKKDVVAWLENQGEIIFSELKESEDEKIRNWLIGYFHQYKEDGMEKYANGLKVESIIAWLEKQGEVFDKIVERARTGKQRVLVTESDGVANIDWDTRSLQDTKLLMEYGLNYIKKIESKGEQKPTDKVETKFHEGDWVILTAGELSTTLQIAKVDTNKKLYWFNDSSYLPIVDEECLHFWTIQDAKDGDVLDANGAPFIYKKHNKDYVYCYCGVNLSGDFIDAKGFGNWNNNCKVYPATKEQRDLLFAKMKEAGYEWDAEKKELKKKIDNEIEIPFGAKDSELQESTYFIPKGFHAEIDDDKVVIKKGEKPTAWSEEDEKIFKIIISNLETLRFSEEMRTTYSYVPSTSTNYYQTLIDWLKSLKDRYTWKPSDEQMDALQYIYRNLNPPLSDKLGWSSIRTLELLYNDLKKLREKQ